MTTGPPRRTPSQVSPGTRKGLRPLLVRQRQASQLQAPWGPPRKFSAQCCVGAAGSTPGQCLITSARARAEYNCVLREENRPLAHGGALLCNCAPRTVSPDCAPSCCAAHAPGSSRLAACARRWTRAAGRMTWTARRSHCPSWSARHDRCQQSRLSPRRACDTWHADARRVDLGP